jgi:RNA polymerase primary sigma factor
MAEEERTPEVNRLIILGKEKGFLTYGDLNNSLPAEMATTERITSLMVMFGEMDIEVIDSPEGERYQRMPSEGEGGAEESEEQEETEEEDKKIDLTPGALSRTDDPVRLYLKEMGSVSLLSREGEIEIAKRIEEGKKDIASVVFGMPKKNSMRSSSKTKKSCAIEPWKLFARSRRRRTSCWVCTPNTDWPA